jgi:UDP-N-acetylmuramate dehydrogenase
VSIDIQYDVPLAPFTTLGLGGHARYFIPVYSIEDLREALAWARSKSHPFYVLGGGSNTIFCDAGFDGVVIHIRIRGCERSGSELTIGAGEVWDAVVIRSIESGLSGIECLSGIPGLAGATPVQNVGAYGQEVASTIVSVTGLNSETGELQTMKNGDCGFSYRNSVFKKGYPLIITEIVFRLSEIDPQPEYPELKEAFERNIETFIEKGNRDPDRPERLQLLRSTVLSIRRRKSMLIDPEDPDSKSAGSFFTNPVLDQAQYDEFRRRAACLGLKPPVFRSGEMIKLSAAWLVENSGFARGYTENGAGISKAHALALVNRGGTTEALLDLAGKITRSVRERFGIELEREPVFVC